MCEAATGITDYDSEIADLLRRSKKPVVLCVNKVDSGEKMYDAFDFYGLGLGEVWSISAANGSGTGDLLDEILRLLPEDDAEADDHSDIPHIAIVGRPNVGKSSMTNALLGEERNIVTPVAGTTRDSISTWEEKIARNHELPKVENIGLEGETIFMKLSQKADSIRVNGQDHATLALACDTDSLAYTFRPEDPFARMTAFFPDGAVIYSNPFARYDAASAPDPFNNAPQRVNWVLTVLYNLLALALIGLLLRALVKLFRKR